jgi:hypothetical protein
MKHTYILWYMCLASLAVYPLAGCAETANPDVQLGRLGTQATAAADDIGAQYAAALTNLNQRDAETVVKSNHLLRLTDSSRADKLGNLEIARRLVAAAEAKSPGTPSTTGTTLEKVEPSKLQPAERESVARLCERNILDIANRLHDAALSRALPQWFEAEAELKIVHDNLRSALGKSANLPQDPIALLPSAYFEKIIDAMEPTRRFYEYYEATWPTNYSPDRRQLEYIKGWINRLKTVAASEEHRQFNSSREATYRKITKKSWTDIQAANEQRIAEEARRLTSVAVAATNWQELEGSRPPVRGPPSEPLKSVVEFAIRNFDIDVTTSVVSLARCKALADELGGTDEFKDAVREPKGPRLQAVLCFLDDAELSSLRSLVEVKTADSLQTKLRPDRFHYASEWADAIDQEFARRRGGGKRPSIEDGSNLAKRVESLASPQGQDARVDLHLVRIVDLWFPSTTAPAALVDLKNKITQRDLKSYGERIREAIVGLQKVGDRLARTTTVPDNGVIKAFRDSRDHLNAAIDRYEQLVNAAEAAGIDVKASREFIIAFRAGSPRDGPDWQPPPLSAANLPKSPGPSSPSGGFAVAEIDLQRLRDARPSASVSDPHLELQLIPLEYHLQVFSKIFEENSKTVDSLDVNPRLLADAKGRRKIRESDLPSDGNWPVMRPDEDLPRLPPSLKWKGRLKPDGTPYDYEAEVKSPKTFDAVGGGIHLGEVAKVDSKVDLRSYTLVYTKKDGLHFRSGKDNSKISIDADVSPEIMKALYCFAASGRNAAISIGWAQGTPDNALKFDLLNQNSSAVLLDPFFVDTPVGRDLIVADSIPWNLDQQRLPNNREIPFHNQFKQGVDTYRKTQVKTLLPAFEGIKPFSSGSRVMWADRLEAADVPPIVCALARYAESKEAKEWYCLKELKGFLKDKGAPTSPDGNPREEFRAWLKTRALKENNIESEDRLTDESKRLLNNDIETRLAKLESLLGEQFDKLVQSNPNDPLGFTTSIAVLSLASAGACPRPLVELWAALQLDQRKAAPPSKEQLAEGMAWLLNATTLAVLYDDSVAATVTSAEVKLDVRLRYRYATTYLEVSQKSVGIGRAPDDPNSQVQTLKPLTDLANDHIDWLVQSYGPLQHIQRHAGIAALIRWARTAREKGELGGLVFDELATVPVHDSRFATPDALERKK